MDTVVLRGPGLATDKTPAPPPETPRLLTVTATYVLSEDGRKASLLAGGNGRAVQELSIDVPANRLHLVSVDDQGVARLKLQPRYDRDGEQTIVRSDTPPTYDKPPSIEDLYREAARNHELERAYHQQRTAARTERRDAQRQQRAQLAQKFMNDRAQRALVHPAPTPKRCYLATEHGRVLFDINTDEAIARDVPPEAHRRFRADLRGRRDENLRQRAEQLALHEEKKRLIAEWIEGHGTPEQQSRQAAGVLPIAEAIEAMTDEAFAVVGDRPRYLRDGALQLQAHLRRSPRYANAVVASADLVVTSKNAGQATAAQWALVQELQNVAPDATVALRVHRLSWKQDPQAPTLTIYGVLVTRKAGPFTLRREYAAPGVDAEQSVRLDELAVVVSAVGVAR
jgi:hypothetical protein